MLGARISLCFTNALKERVRVFSAHLKTVGIWLLQNMLAEAGKTERS